VLLGQEEEVESEEGVIATAITTKNAPIHCVMMSLDEITRLVGDVGGLG